MTGVALRVQVTLAPGLGFLNHSTVDICGQIILCHGGCPVLCKTLSGTSGFYPLDASSTLLVMTTKDVSRHCQISPGGQNYPQLRTTGLSKLFFCVL